MSFGSSFTALLVCVNHVIIARNDIQANTSLKGFLDAKFTIKELDELKFCLGLEVARTKDGISLCQCKYALELISNASLLRCKPSRTSMDNSIWFSKDHGDPLSNVSAYHRLIGHLSYLTTTCLDLSFVVNQLSQFLSSPTCIHQQATTKVLQYIKGTPGLGLFFPASSYLKIKAYSDFDWATCADTRCSKKQSTVSRSSCEAKYRALTATTCELQWFSYVLHDLKLSITSPTAIDYDNNLALHIAHNPLFHDCTKHIEHDCHLVREKIQQALFVYSPSPLNFSSQTLSPRLCLLLPASFCHLHSKLGFLSTFQLAVGPACRGRVQHRL